MKDISTLVKTIEYINQRRSSLLYVNASVSFENAAINNAVIAELDIIIKSLNNAIQRIAENRLMSDGI